MFVSLHHVFLFGLLFSSYAATSLTHSHVLFFCSCRSCSLTCQMTCWKTAETPPQSWTTPPAAIKTPPIGKYVDCPVFAEHWMCYKTAINTLSMTLLPCSPQSTWTPQWSADARSNSQQKVSVFKWTDLPQMEFNLIITDGLLLLLN